MRLTSDGARVTCLVLVLTCAVSQGQIAAPAKPAVNQDSLVIATFEGQIKEYMKLHNRAQAGIRSRKPTDSAHIINEGQRLLASRIREARPDAKAGDIFTPEVSQVFKLLIARTMQGPQANEIRATLRHAEPVGKVPLRVNAPYPEHLPLQSSPPSLLLNLPELPPELDYRIVGRDLVLRDAGADIIVDFITNAIPSS